MSDKQNKNSRSACLGMFLHQRASRLPAQLTQNNTQKEESIDKKEGIKKAKYQLFIF